MSTSTATLTTINTETKKPVRPVGGFFGFDEEFDEAEKYQSQPEQQIEKCISGPGSITLNKNPEEDEPRQTAIPDVVKKAFEQTPNTVAEIGGNVLGFLGMTGQETVGALGDLWKQVNIESEALEKESQGQVDPKAAENAKKKQEEAWIKKQAYDVIEKGKVQVPQQEYEEAVKMALRMGVNVEKLANQLHTSHLKKETLLRTYYIALGATEEEADKKVAKQAQKQQNMAETKGQSKDNGQLRLDKQEGNSITANAITTGG